jgi:hypothetical protein
MDEKKSTVKSIGEIFGFRSIEEQEPTFDDDPETTVQFVSVYHPEKIKNEAIRRFVMFNNAFARRVNEGLDLVHSEFFQKVFESIWKQLKSVEENAGNGKDPQYYDIFIKQAKWSEILKAQALLKDILPHIDFSKWRRFYENRNQSNNGIENE